jgi:uncharacterized membrane protein
MYYFINRLLVITIFLLVFIPLAYSDLDYSIAIKDYGESIVLITFSEEKEYTIYIPLDSEMKGKGIIYMPKDIEGYKEVFIKAKKGGVLVYKTNSYTTKTGSEWNFKFSPHNFSKIKVSIPKNSLIIKTNPLAFINDQIIQFENYNNNFNESNYISIEYSFSDINLSHSYFSFFSAIIYLLILIILISILYILFTKKRNISQYNHVVKMLSNNEKKIVLMLKEEKGEMKRNNLEKKSKISKSSLAHALNKLEDKNIIKIDKSFTTHKIKLNDWFLGLK